MTLPHPVEVILGPPGVFRFVRVVVLAFTLSAVGRLLPVDTVVRRALSGGRRRRQSYALWGAGAVAVVAGITEFSRATGAEPGIALYYSAWNDPFQARFAASARAHHTTPFIQMLPYGVPLTSITAGRSDAYLRSSAAAARAFGAPVIIGFGPEMNGNWYGCGAGRSTPASFVAAWRHVVRTFRAAGANNVTWVWTINAVNAAHSPLRQWWPGASYVTWVGIDGYYYTPTDTFGTVFGVTISQLRTFTARPVLISETAAGPSAARPGQIAGLFRGAEQNTSSAWSGSTRPSTTATITRIGAWKTARPP
jgi:mannan endo-1,4-beta-mannosidase